MNLTITNTALGVWTFTWEEESGVSYNIYLGGVLLDTVDEGEWVSTVPGYLSSPPPVEIVPDNETAESLTYPPFLRLQWRIVEGEAGYRVEEYVGGSWVTRREIMDNGSEYYSYKTPLLEDGSTANWRVSAFGKQGDAGTPVVFTVEIVRNPSTPDVSLDYDESTGDLTISGEES